MKNVSENAAHELYTELCSEKYEQRPYHKEKRGEQMELVEEVICRYWKPRYLLDHASQTAFEFMDRGGTLLTVGMGDIIWVTVGGMKGIERALARNAHFPTRVHNFADGVAEVSWQINPDGMYYMDDDGFGMTDDDEETLYGYIDKQGRVVARFRAISDFAELKEMRREAIENLNK